MSHPRALLVAALSLALLLLAPLAAAYQNPQYFTPISGRYSGKSSNYGGPYDGMDPNQPSFGLLNGGCGYGVLNDWNAYPQRCGITHSPVSTLPQPLNSLTLKRKKH